MVEEPSVNIAMACYRCRNGLEHGHVIFDFNCGVKCASQQLRVAY